MLKIFNFKKAIAPAKLVGAILLAIVIVILISQFTGDNNPKDLIENNLVASMNIKSYQCDEFPQTCDVKLCTYDVKCTDKEKELSDKYLLYKSHCDSFDDNNIPKECGGVLYKKISLALDSDYETASRNNPLPSQINTGSGQVAVVGQSKLDMISRANQEYEKWGGGTLKENNPKAQDYLKTYWDFVGSSSWNYEVAWSAVFISYVTQDFKTAMHSVYINGAYNGKNNWDFYKQDKKKIELGDLICNTRDGDKFNPKNNYKSHCDIVVLVDKNKAYVIGGNVGNSVGRKVYFLNEKGYIANIPSNAIGVLSRKN